MIKDILQKIEDQIHNTNLSEEFSEKGFVLEIKDWVATVSWLNNAKYSEIVIFENWAKWLILDMMQEYIWVLILGDYSGIAQWQTVKSTWQLFSIWVWEELLGRVLSSLGDPVDGLWSIKVDKFLPIEKVAPWVITRQSVDQPLQTWIKAIDSMIPIGRWQRQLIIWDRQTGKTTVAIDTILAQKDQNVICIYVAIGQKESKIARIVDNIKLQWAMDYTIVINAPINNPAVIQYIAPYTWVTIAEYFLSQGKDVLIIYDDLTKHAAAYREMSLLLRRPPGREAYPGDVFYLHSRLLERACRLNKDYGWWSITALPIIETQSGDVSAYIPTNVISITDGQIYLESNLFNAGIRPAINVWLSVSRVWWSAQTGIIKKISGTLKLELANFRELETFAKFGSDLDQSTQDKLNRWHKLTEILKQKENHPITFDKQAVIFYAGIKWYLDNVDMRDILTFENNIYEKLDTSYKKLSQQIFQDRKLTEDIESQIQKLITETTNEII